MRTIRSLFVLVAVAAAVLLAPAAATAQTTKVTMGKLLGGIGLHIPSYVAYDRGFFKEEGLDLSLVSLVGRPMVTAGLAGKINFVPIPSGGAGAVLSGAKLRYIVGQSLKPQWIIVTRANINRPEDLKGKTLGYARPGAADYDEGAAVLERFFNMKVGRDYKVISFQAEPERIAALANGDIDGALVSAPRAGAARKAGLKVLLRTGDFLPRAGGAFWTTEAFYESNPDAVKKFIRAIARGVTFLRTNRAGSIPSIKEHLGIASDEEAGIVWEELHNTFGAELPKDLFREIFEARRQFMIAAKQWPADKPLPDPEQFLARDLLERTLKEMGYVPTKLEAPKN